MTHSIYCELEGFPGPLAEKNTNKRTLDKTFVRCIFIPVHEKHLCVPNVYVYTVKSTCRKSFQSLAMPKKILVEVCENKKCCESTSQVSISTTAFYS